MIHILKPAGCAWQLKPPISPVVVSSPHTWTCIFWPLSSSPASFLEFSLHLFYPYAHLLLLCLLFLSQERSMLLPLFFSPLTFFNLSTLCYSPLSFPHSLPLWLSEDLLTKRCEERTKCFLLSINNVLYACVALGLPGCGREKGRCLQRFIHCSISLSQIFLHFFFPTLTPSSEKMASSGLEERTITRVQWDNKPNSL